MTEQKFAAGAPDAGAAFSGSSAIYQIHLRQLDADFKILNLGEPGGLDKWFEETFGKEGLGDLFGVKMGYVEISKQNSETPVGDLVGRFASGGFKHYSENPTGFTTRLLPGRHIALVTGNEHSPLEKNDFYWVSDPAEDQERYPGRLQFIDDPDYPATLLATVNEKQMLEIQRAMLIATNEFNRKITLFDGVDNVNGANANTYAEAMQTVVKNTMKQMGLDVSAIPDSKQTAFSIPEIPLFDRSLVELRDEVNKHQVHNATQIDRLRQDIDVDLNKPEATVSGVAPTR